MTDQLTFEVDQQQRDMAQAAALVGKARKLVKPYDTGQGTAHYLVWSMETDLGFLSVLAGRGRHNSRPRPRRKACTTQPGAFVR